MCGRRQRVILVSVTLAAGCSAPSPDPARMAVDLPPAVDVAEADARQAAELAERGLAAARAGDHEAARTVAQQALALDPRSARARAALGAALMGLAQVAVPPQLDRWRQAEGELRRARALAPRDVEIGLWLARFFAADGHLQAALDELERILDLQPEHIGALRLAGFLAYEANVERRARSFLARLLVQSPDDGPARYRLAQCETALAGRQTDPQAERAAWDAAAAVWQEYRTREPDDAAGLLGEAHARFRRAALEAAADPGELGRIRALYVEHAARVDAADGYFGEGVVLEAMGDPQAAAAAYRRALDRQPDHVGSLLNLAALRAAAGDQAEAEALAARAERSGGLTPWEARRLRSR